MPTEHQPLILQREGSGKYIKAMWWSDLNIMTPFCDAVGKVTAQ